MVSSSRIDPVVLGHILAQHHDLHSRLLALKAAFTEGRGTAAERADVHARCRDLRDSLAAHFVAEEQGGYLEESIARLPRLSVAAREVMNEHPRLLAELDALLQRLSTRDSRVDTWASAARGFAAFTDHLLAHERNENAVVQQGFNEDFGFPE
jgi:hypothetical protein